MNRRLSRRDFLKLMGTMTGAGMVSACVPQATTTNPAATSSSIPTSSATSPRCATATSIPIPPPTPVGTNFDVYAYYLQGRGVHTADPRTGYGFATVVPLYGEVQDLTTMKIDMKWAREHGVTTFIMPAIQKGGIWERRIDELFLPASEPPFNINYSLMFNPPLPGGNDDYTLSEGARRVSELLNAHVGHPRYKRLSDGRPVVFYFLAFVVAYWGGVDQVEESVDILRRSISEDVFLVGDAMSEVTDALYTDPKWTAPGFVERLVKSFDAVSSYYMWRSGYDWHSDYEYRHVVTSFGSMIRGYQEAAEVWRDKAHKYGAKFFPPISPAGLSNRLLYEAGLDADLVDRHEGVSYETAKEMAEVGAKYADPDLKSVVVGAWNECNEGAAIVPSKGFKFGPAHAVRDTFAVQPAGGWPEDYYPPT